MKSMPRNCEELLAIKRERVVAASERHGARCLRIAIFSTVQFTIDVGLIMTLNPHSLTLGHFRHGRMRRGR
jgi:hypothetical protein